MRILGPVLWLLVGFGALAWFHSHPLIFEGKVAHSSKNLQRAVRLAKTCQLYARDHDGETPANLAEFDASDYWGDDFDPKRLDYFDPKSGRQMPWLYFPIKNIAKADGDTAFFLSPVAFEGKRVVVFTDCSGKIVKEKECEEMLERQRGE